MGRTIKIFDTTLRDGEQSPGCSMNLNEKIEVARQLEALRVDIIEAVSYTHLDVYKRQTQGVQTIIAYFDGQQEEDKRKKHWSAR